MERVTLCDIAEKVGVTKGLVSRALTGKYNVSDEMRAIITRAAVEMGYDFKKLRTKAKKRSNCMLAMTSFMLSNEDYWQPIIKGITATLEEARINLEYYIYDEKLLSQKDAEKIKSANVSGYILMHNNPELLLRAMEATNRPVIVIDPRSFRTGEHLQIEFSNHDSFYTLTKMLLENGHRHILFYGAKGWSVSFDEREEGFTACMRDHEEEGAVAYRVIFDNAPLQFADNERLEAALSSNPQITAIVCVNDIVAQNAIRTVEKLKKRVPEDYSLVGFDDIRESQADGMNLTTVNVPRTALGVEAATYMIRHINSKQIKYSKIVINCEIISRGSIQKL